MKKYSFIKKLFFKIEHKLLVYIHKINYKYFKYRYPVYLKKTGLNFSGDIKKTGFIAPSTNFDSYDYAKHITIGEETIISGGCLFLVHDYSIATALRVMGKVTNGKLPHIIKEISIGDNCFIGIRSIILPGTKIGNNVIVGAGSVVKGHIPSNVIVAGNPAIIIKSIEEYAHKHIENNDYIGEFFL